MPTKRDPTYGHPSRPPALDHAVTWKRVIVGFGLVTVAFLLIVALSYPRISAILVAVGAGTYAAHKAVRTAWPKRWFGSDRSRPASARQSAKSNPEILVGYSDVFAFVVVVLGLSWTGFLPSHLASASGVRTPASLEILLDGVAILSPLVATVVLVGTRSGVGSVRTFLQSRFRGRASPKWYVFALAFFPLLYAGPVVVFLLWSEHPVTIDGATRMLLVNVFTLGIVTNLIETVGWRGYLQEGLQSLHSAVGASLAVGVVWGLWHAPLFLVANAPLAGLPYDWYLVLLVGLSVIFGWVYNETEGSVAVVTLLHCGQNAAIAPVLFSLLEMDVDVTPLVALSTLAVWLVVAFIYTRTNPETLSMYGSDSA